MIEFPIKFAIVDDEPDITSIFSMICSQNELIKPYVYNDPVEAFEMIGKEKIQAAMIDLDMPVITGDDLIKKCRQNYAWNINFIVCSGVQKVTRAIRCFNLGADILLMKPASSKDISTAVEKIVQKHKEWDQVIKAIGSGGSG